LTASETISAFLEFLKSCNERYAIEFENVHQKDLESCDLLHKLELQTLTYHQEAHLAADLKKVRSERRESKDAVTVLEPIKAYYESNTTAIKTLERLLGDVRKAEKSLENRVYIPRVRKDSEET
jgi:glycyl-tRNA synthetase alpha subunit